MAVNAEKLVVEVALEWLSLRVKLLLGYRESNLVCTAPRTVDVLVLTGSTFFFGFTISRGVVDADVEDCTTMERRGKK